MGTENEGRGRGNGPSAWDHPEASSVVEGPVGWSKLRDPATVDQEGSHESELPEIEPDLRPDHRNAKAQTRA